MEKADAQEAAGIVQRTLTALVGTVPAQGRDGSDLRVACGRLSVSAAALLQTNQAGQPLADCFDLARTNGATQPQIAGVRAKVIAEAPVLVGAIFTQNNIVRLCLATEGAIVANMEFDCRADVEALQASMNSAFAGVEETAADNMEQDGFQAVVALHAAMNGFLTDEARPLPQMLRFAFASSMPSLKMAHRLYADAGRADDLRAENAIVHPAFMQPTGRAFSA